MSERSPGTSSERPKGHPTSVLILATVLGVLAGPAVDRLLNGSPTAVASASLALDVQRECKHEIAQLGFELGGATQYASTISGELALCQDEREQAKNLALLFYIAAETNRQAAQECIPEDTWSLESPATPAVPNMPIFPNHQGSTKGYTF
jgi:hypothetical protein